MGLPEGAHQIRGRIWSVGSELKSVFDATPDGTRLVTGFASRPTVDRVNEVVDTSAFEKSLTVFRQNPVMLYMHDPRRPIGKFTQIDLTPEGLAVTGELARGTQDSEDAWKLIQQGVLKAFSIGFRELGDGALDENEVHHITDLELYEVSVVSIPANREALFTMAEGKLLDVQMLNVAKVPASTVKGVIPYRKYPTQSQDASWDAGTARATMASYAKSGDGYDFTKYRLGFTFVEDGAQTNLTGYKLPHHVVVGGELRTNLRGCRAVIAVLAGARGGAGIPDAARQGVYNHVARHITTDFNAAVPAYSDLSAAMLNDEAATLAEMDVTDEELDTLLGTSPSDSTESLPGDGGTSEQTAAATEDSATEGTTDTAPAAPVVDETLVALQTQVAGLQERVGELEVLFAGFMKREVEKIMERVQESGIDLSDLATGDNDQAGDGGEPGPTAAPTA